MTTMLTIKIHYLQLIRLKKRKEKNYSLKLLLYYIIFYSLIKLIYMWRCHCVLTSL